MSQPSVGSLFYATIAAMDFFAVPTITFGVLYCFFVISHDRRRILHFNFTKHPRACVSFSSCGRSFHSVSSQVSGL